MAISYMGPFKVCLYHMYQQIQWRTYFRSPCRPGFKILCGGSSVCSLFLVILLARRILRWLVDFLNTSAPCRGLTIQISSFCPRSVVMRFVRLTEQTVIISPYSINWLIFVTKKVGVYCAVRTGSLYTG